jgi:hypothetical protein
MQKMGKNKGLTVLICDDNKKEMSNLSDVLHEGDSWFDPIYLEKKTKRQNVTWVLEGERFDQIINLRLRSNHSIHPWSKWLTQCLTFIVVTLS